MKQIGFILPILACGCVQVTVPPSDAASGSPSGSPLSSGIYRGTTFCEFEAEENGQTATLTEETSEVLVISESGIPMRNGQEEYDGRTERDSFSGIDFIARVAGVSVFPNGVNIITVGDATTEGARLSFREEAVYRPLRNGQIEWTSDLFMAFNADTESFSAAGICTGIFSQ
ncbi:MAG: hypothetical protein IH987_17550 [Planctomycetes bacterium]|nr:hypothetical protein [Planctomycetota bacterium]